MSPFQPVLCLTILSAGCRTSSRTAKEVTVPAQFSYYKEPPDSARYTNVKYRFYTDTSGLLYEKKFLQGSPDCHCEFLVIYDSDLRIWTDDSSYSVPLGSIIDIKNYVELDSTQCSKDKNRVYYFYGNSDGGTRLLVNSLQ